MAFTLAPDFGPSRFKEATAEYTLDPERALRACFAAEESARLLGEADKELAKAYRKDIQFITLYDAAYPAALKETHGAPILLYAMGDLRAFEKVGIGIVGSRRSTAYGMQQARSLARDLANAGIAIVSGLALGIDTAAHQGALEADGVTIAVLGTGLSTIYPASNKAIAAKILKRGLVISEYPMDMMGLPENFPRRNRIISGLSRAVVVVEAARKSGSLITADQALEQGRDVFAVPGNVGAPMSEGCNKLIQQGAKLVTCAEDVLHGIRAEFNQRDLFKATVARPSLNEEENKIMALISHEPINVDEILENAELSSNRVMSVLLALEMKGVIRQSAGKNFSLI